MDKLPTVQALEGLADIYSTLAVEPPDRLLICSMAVLTATGFRIGELLTLPLDCEIEETRDGKLRYGLRFYKKKPRSSERQFAIKWVTPKGAELVKKALAEIKEITAPFRKQAKLLEQTPNVFPLIGYQWDQKLSAKEAADLIGFNSNKALYAAVKNRQSDGKSFFYYVGDISNYLFSRRVERLWTLKRNDGTYQMLSETLLLAPKNFFHGQRGVIKLLIEPLTDGFISDFLTGKSGIKSVFERFNLKEPDGIFCR